MKPMITLFKKYNKILGLLLIILIVFIILLNQSPIKINISYFNSEKSNLFNFNKENKIRKQIIIDKSEDKATLGYSGQRKIVKDKAGNFYIAYRKKYNSYYEIFVAKLEKIADNDWSVSGIDKPIILMNATQRVPSIAIDSQDVLHIVWYGPDSKDEKKHRQIKYLKSTDQGGSWISFKNISPVFGYSGHAYWQEHPVIFAGLDDKLYVVWEGKDSQNENQQIKFSKSIDAGKTWTQWINIGVSPGNSQSRPNITQETNGRLHVLMYSSLGKEIQQLWHSYSEEDGKNWSVWQNISNSSFDSRHISIIMDKDNRLHAVWRARYNNDKTQIHYSTLKEGAWTKPILIAESSNYQFFPDIIIKEQSLPYIIWMESEKDYGFPKERPEKGNIYSTYSIDNKGTFSEARQLSSGKYNLYPSFLEISDQSSFPFIYSKIEDSLSSIILDWI